MTWRRSTPFAVMEDRSLATGPAMAGLGRWMPPDGPECGIVLIGRPGAARDRSYWVRSLDSGNQNTPRKERHSFLGVLLTGLNGSRP